MRRREEAVVTAGRPMAASHVVLALAGTTFNLSFVSTVPKFFELPWQLYTWPWSLSESVSATLEF